MGKLDGKVAIVTGAGRGIGRAIALAFAREGASVGLAARTKGEIEAVRKEVEALGANAIAVPTDVTDDAQVEAMVEAVLRDLGGVHILVNNAGVIAVGAVVSLSTEQWRRGIDVNLTGTFYFARAVLPKMLEQQYGKIINIGSRAGKIATPGASAYSAAKWGVIGFTKSLSEEVKKLGIQVNALCPGFVDTEMVRPIRDQLVVVMAPEEIAKVVLFLATDDAAALMGADIEIYGATERPRGM